MAKLYVFAWAFIASMMGALPAFSFGPQASFTSPSLAMLSTRGNLHRRFTVEDSSLGDSTVPAASEDTDGVPPKPPVKCPNCDLCDGSGRQVFH